MTTDIVATEGSGATLPRGPIRRTLRRWPSWVGWAAAVWSLGYGLLGLLWTLGVPGFPFGAGDLPDARAESILGAATAEHTAPWIAGIGLICAALAVLLTRGRLRGWLRVATAGAGWVVAFGLAVLVPDQRLLTSIAYLPVGLVGIPFGFPPMTYGEFFAKVAPWTTVNLAVCAIGGVLFAAATVAFGRRTASACRRCGRRDGADTGWTSRASAARWGRWAAYTGAVVPLAYSVVRWAWAFNIPVGVSEEFLVELHASGLIWGGVYLATFGALGGLLTLGLVQRWGVIWPRWVLGLAGKRVPPAFPIVFASVVAVSLASASAVVMRIIDWSNPDDWMSNPMTLWPLWSVALGAATLGYYFRTRPACSSCGRGRPQVTSAGPE
ncbi:hypothetical protein [Occultella gossypii]|uniref:Uncharacterized protein n=1 Tax=Occultella gossypii TaxID=2800820 RepID=A0ABS7SF12_9MICO|nr:hypothetical protein [Occultella gossypii]MBZ2198657.1 hypothetical protein [Occultella gossypii]